MKRYVVAGLAVVLAVALAPALVLTGPNTLVARESKNWFYSLDRGRNGEDYSLLYDSQSQLVARMRTRHARAITEAMNAR
jgi:hypothetical protein